MTDLVRVYGLTVRSEVPLHLHRPAAPGSVVDLDIVLGEEVPPTDAPPPGRLVLDLHGSRHHHAATAVTGGYRLRFFGTCDVVLDAGLTRATVHPVTGGRADFVAVLVSGAVLAFVLTMRGATVLHASAVQVEDRVVAFVGASGMGKSTMATLLCAEGARLVTDDVLRLDLPETGGPPTCALGATELRLRRGAQHLAGRFSTAPGLRTTGDARHALAPGPSTAEDLPLSAVVVPVPDRSPVRRTPELTRLPAREALLLLARFPRLLGWRDATVIGTAFHQLADLVDRVPVHLAVLPWGPPFASGTAREVLAATGVADRVPAGSAV